VDVFLVIEVAHSSLAYDMDVKAPLYARHNIPEFWVVDLAEKTFYIFKHPKNGAYQQQLTVKSGTLSPALVAGFAIDTAELWKD
jgi:Uma2 family endonuclease